MPPKAVLAFDTSAAHCAAALLCGGQSPGLQQVDLLQTHVETMAKGQAERLVPMLEEFMAGHGVSWPDIGVIAVGTGPGNFTGIRISVALARGLALGRGIKAVGVTGFEAIAATAGPFPFWAVMDGPRDQAYVQAFGQGGAAAQIIPAAEVGALDARVARLSDLSLDQFIANIAEVGFFKSAMPHPRPAPFYLRGADAAPPSDPPPVILP